MVTKFLTPRWSLAACYVAFLISVAASYEDCRNVSDDAAALLHLHHPADSLGMPRMPPGMPMTTRWIPKGAKKRVYVAPKIHHSSGSVGDVTNFSHAGSELNISCGQTLVSLSFVSEGTLRIRLGPKGRLIGAKNGEIISLPKGTSPTATFVHSSSSFNFSSGDVLLSGSLKPLLLKLSRGGSLLWQESVPMQWNTTSTWQTIKGGGHFYGGGMQNDYSYDHTGKLILIQEPGDDDGWDAGSRANPAPFFMSSQGFGCLRNTFKPGSYQFSQPVTLSHDEFGMDAFYFVAASMKEVLQLYTALAGRPFLPPAWGLYLGDSDCYNNQRHDHDTSYAVNVAKNYSKHDMPRGWMLVNDGYGCGYTTRKMLIETQQDLADHGLRMGLWTSTGLAEASWEISKAGSRVIKTDVAWVWEGYKFGLDAVKLAAKLMIENSNSRPFTWTVCGWAGTQKYAVIWTGDNIGNWKFIRMQIPTIIGSGLSAFAHASGDVDGIFYGSPETYVRDLQWKTFLTVSMYMSGWPNDKQPWSYGEPYTSYNRKWLRLKSRLTPYLYSLAWQAHLSGTPPVRALELEFPDDLWANASALSYQFMSGPFFLVAPVYEDTRVRDNIVLPAGEWIDFFKGKRYDGPRVLNGYDCPLQDLPVFVRAGAIIPLWPALNFFGEKKVEMLTLDVYPPSRGKAKSNFKLYEDDGMTRNYSMGEVATQVFEVLREDAGMLQLCIHPSEGSYAGKLQQRSYWIQVHGMMAGRVLFQGAPMKVHPCDPDGPVGWCYDGDLTIVKTPPVTAEDKACIEMIPAASLAAQTNLIGFQ